MSVQWIDGPVNGKMVQVVASEVMEKAARTFVAIEIVVNGFGKWGRSG